MKLTINTKELQEMVARSIKGAGNNKLLPITSLMAVQVADNTLRLITTDATNYLYVITDVSNSDFSITVYAEQFAKLISKMTSENVTIEVKKNGLEIKGNGTYTLELPYDENGEPIKYPDPLSVYAMPAVEKFIDLATIQSVLTTLKPALATTLEVPCYTSYFVGDTVVATDTFKIASLDENLFGEDVLISDETMNLLSVMRDEKIGVVRKDNDIVFTSQDCYVYGKVMPGIEDYAIDAIDNLVGTEFPSVCKLSKGALLQVLDRLSLFVSTYDKNGIYLTFTKDGVQVSSKASNGIEIIDYVESAGHNNFTCCVDIEMLTSQAKANVSDAITLHYGLDNALKIVDGNITQIIALLEDDRGQA